MRTRRLEIVTLVGVILSVNAELTAQKMSIGYDKGTNFSRYKSYAWVRGTPVADPNLDLYMLNVADVLLEKKNLRKVESHDADLLLTYHAAGDSTLSISGFPDPTFVTVGGIPPPGATVWSSGSTTGNTVHLIRKG